MKIAINELKSKLNGYLVVNGLSRKDANTLAGLIVDQELIGNRFSPIEELPGKQDRLAAHAASTGEEVVSEKPSLVLIKGNGKLASIITADHLDEMIAGAKRQGIYAFGLYDSTYNEFFEIFCRRIAAQDCIAIIAENGGPQGVVPYGGRKDILGTNPLAYGIPTNKDPVVFDGATAMHAYGRIRQAKERHEQLPEGYLDKDGKPTADPVQAIAILPFGGYKGYAINLLVDVLSGCLVRGRSGLDQPTDSQRYIGTLVIVIDPASFGDLTEFKNSTTKLMEDILAIPPIDPAEPVKVPGLRGAQHRRSLEAEGKIEVNDSAWDKLTATISNEK